MTIVLGLYRSTVHAKAQRSSTQRSPLPVQVVPPHALPAVCHRPWTTAKLHKKAQAVDKAEGSEVKHSMGNVRVSAGMLNMYNEQNALASGG